ncbi:hypothetical protein RND71_004930 [Anisodus tanguticus]|uniref:Protein ENHANCED DISEASE RESISTANCE 2-like n=1 Tax=Anisodus tanguticus TaxID=243964 RepID=A0AAE1SRG4_9SOLA|nr:hypothetical protein RND71_004930 [Anisodus tanguticus]
MSKVVYEGWMVRYGRRKIGRSYIHMRYFVLETRLLAYYKRKPQDNVVPIKTLPIDGNCRVEDRGLKTHHGHMVYVLSVYNKKDKYNRVTMAAFNIQEALIWKEKIESIIDQHQESQGINGNKYNSFGSDMDNGRNASSSDHESQFSAAEDEYDSHPNLMRRTTIGRGPPESVFDWTKELDSDLANQNGSNQAFSRKYWRLLQCQNGLRIFEELLDGDLLPKSCSRAMKAVGVVEASCEDIFELVMSMDATRFEWDCSFQYGSLVEEVDGHTAILYHRLQLDWFPTLVWPRDLCYVRYWRRNDDGSYVVLFRSREHENCGPLPGYVRAHIESDVPTVVLHGKSQGSKIGIIVKKEYRWNILGYCLVNWEKMIRRSSARNIEKQPWEGKDINNLWRIIWTMNTPKKVILLNGLREYFSQTDERTAAPRIPVMVNMTSASVSSKRSQKLQETPHHRTRSLDQIRAANRNASMMDEYSDEEEDFQGADQEVMPPSPEHEMKRTALEEEPLDQIDFSIFSGNLRRDDRDNGRNCWRISDGNNFRVRSKNYCYDKSKIPAGKPLMDLVSVDWFKDTKRMDHVARRPGCASQGSLEDLYGLLGYGFFTMGRKVIFLRTDVVLRKSPINHVATEKGLFSLIVNVQVPGSTHYSMVFYFVMKELTPGSLLQRFVDGDDEFRNSRMKLIPSVPKIDVDIGSSTVANGVLGLVIGVITSLVVDMAFLVQGNTPDELPEQLIGAVRASHIELSSAIVPKLEPDATE